MASRKTTNSKAEAGRARKAEQAAKKAQKQAQEEEERVSKDWKKGSDIRGQARADAAAAKADEAARKKREKEALLAAEEAALGSGGKVKKAPAGKKGKKKNDLSLLEDALTTEAEKKQKAKKRAEQLKKEKEAAALKAKAEEKSQDPLLQNTNQMLGGAVGRDANVQTMAGEGSSGLDAALDTLNITAGTDVKRMKALYLAFEDKMMPIVKEENPGLRHTQYKEKISNLWKKAPENPMNKHS